MLYLHQWFVVNDQEVQWWMLQFQLLKFQDCVNVSTFLYF